MKNAPSPCPISKPFPLHKYFAGKRKLFQNVAKMHGFLGSFSNRLGSYFQNFLALGLDTVADLIYVLFCPTITIGGTLDGLFDLF